jgi:hypothetical protein
MDLIKERISVEAKAFLNERNINEAAEYREPLYQMKLSLFGWDLDFSAASIFCEVVWKRAYKGYVLNYNELDRLFSPSPVATHANFRGCNSYKTGNVPEVGSLAIWRRGNTWQGAMGIVVGVSPDMTTFGIMEGRVMEGSNGKFIKVQEGLDKRLSLPFAQDKLNLIGFVYPKKQDIE